jgi:hypothetical protein
MKKRGFALWLFIGLSLAASVYYFAEAGQAIRSWTMLTIMQYRFGPLYPVFQGMLLGLGFLATAVWLFRRNPVSLWLGSLFAVLSVLWHWLDRLVFSLNPLPVLQQWFPIAFSLLLLGLVLGGLWSLAPDMVSSALANEENISHPSSQGGDHES